MKYVTEIISKPTVFLKARNIPAVEKAMKEGLKIYFSNSVNDVDELLFDGGIDYREWRRFNVKKAQADGKGLISYREGLYQYAYAKRSN